MREEGYGRAAYDELAPWLPPKINSILDIGSGGAWIDVFIAQKHGTTIVHLMDGREGHCGPKLCGYHEATAPWWGVEQGAERVRNLTKARVVTHDPDPKLTIPVDVAVSLRSWCHHYPVGHYLGLARRSLQIGGLLIVDIRNGTDGAKVLEKSGFRQLWAGGASARCLRTVFERI